MNLIWLTMIVVGALASVLGAGGNTSGVTDAIFSGSSEAVKLAISLAGILAFWSGIMRLAEDAGLTRFLAKLLSPIVQKLFPSVPADHPALGSVLLALSANILGLGNAATPLGIKAMEAMQDLNRDPKQPSDAMCTFLAMCASGLTIVPTTIIALRAAAGSKDPSSVVGAIIFATTCSTAGALITDHLLRGGAHRV